MPGMNKSAAKAVIESILKKIRSSVYLAGEKNPTKLTASFGIAVFPDDAENKKDLLLKADNMMYSIKKTCKDGVGVI
jgi:diguanylate cyclase (GGDEF)-like protein